MNIATHLSMSMMTVRMVWRRDLHLQQFVFHVTQLNGPMSTSEPGYTGARENSPSHTLTPMSFLPLVTFSAPCRRQILLLSLEIIPQVQLCSDIFRVCGNHLPESSRLRRRYLLRVLPLQGIGPDQGLRDSPHHQLAQVRLWHTLYSPHQLLFQLLNLQIKSAPQISMSTTTGHFSLTKKMVTCSCGSSSWSSSIAPAMRTSSAGRGTLPTASSSSRNPKTSQPCGASGSPKRI